jgi:NADH-quinone oxidoreductase subunit H
MQISSPFISSVFSYVYSKLLQVLPSSADKAVSLLVGMLVFAIIIGVLVTLFVYFFGWGERKLMARAHSRHGPTYVGKFGILQNLADVVKLLAKENIIPDKADNPLFKLSLPIVYALFVLIVIFTPLTSTFVGINTSLALIAVFLILSFIPILMFIIGWASGNKFGSIGAQRSIVMLISYEIPLLLVIAAIAMLAHSYSLSTIVNNQSSIWYVALMPIGFIVFFIVMLAEMERPPFDLREADSELIAGWLTDVSAPYYGLALFLDYTRIFVGTLLIAVLFFGGWGGPVLPPFAWILIKIIILSIAIVIIRVTVVRMKINRLLRFGWLYLLPLSIINLIVTFVLFIR